MDINKYIEEGKKYGADLSWLAGAQGGAAVAGQTLPGATAGAQPSLAPAPITQTGGIERLSPGASQLMQAIQHAQVNTPVYMPFAPGTPTQQRRQADEASRQFETGHEFDREQFDWKRDMSEREFAAQQAYRAAQLALQRAAAAGKGSGAGGAGGYEQRTATLTERDRIPYSDAGRRMIEDIRNNPDINLGQWKATVQGDSQIRSALMEQGIDINDFLNFIDEQYTLYHLMEAMGRVGQPVAPWDYGQDLQSRQDLIQKYNPWGKPAAQAEKPTVDQEAEKRWNSFTPQQQADIKQQLINYGANEISAKNIDMLTPRQLLEYWETMLKGK